MKISEDVVYVGVNDTKIDLFEGQFAVKNGMSYNSYIIFGEKIAVLDSVDQNFGNEWISNIESALNSRQKSAPDFLVVHHMECDHSANIDLFAKTFPGAKIVSSAAAFAMMKNYFGTDFLERRIVVKEGDLLELGRHSLKFLGAPLIHWPEVIFSYDSTEKILFSADGFGKFGAINYENPLDDWECEARRYYFGIVGKFGANVQNVLKKVLDLQINTICPLHGPVLNKNLLHYIELYKTWSSYEVESSGVTIAYSSVYGHTKKAAELLAQKLLENGCEKVAISDLAREDFHEIIEDSFRYGVLVLASPTYNGGIFPAMKNFLENLIERNFQNRKIAIIENGTWSPVAAKLIRAMLESCKNLSFCKNSVTIRGALNSESKEQISLLANEISPLAKI